MKRLKVIVLLLDLFVLAAILSAGGQEAKAGQPGKTTVEFQSWNPDISRFPPVKASFEEKNPDLLINYEMVLNSDHYRKLKIDLASGGGADVIAMQAGAPMAEFADFLTELTPYAVKEWGDKWQDIFNPFVHTLLNNKGRYYGMPMGITFAGTLWADRAWLKKYNLQLPQNLNDLRNVSKVLRSKGDFPVTIGAKDDWINLDVWMNIANDINTQKLYSAIEGKTPFTDPQLIESFKIWQQLFTEGIVQDGALGVNVYNDTNDLFVKEGSIPMILNGSWSMSQYFSTDPNVNRTWNDGTRDNVILRVDWNNDGKQAPLQSSVDVIYCINKNTKIPQEAWRFIAFMMFGGQDILINRHLSYFPSRIGAKFEGKLSEYGLANFNRVLEWSKNDVGGYRENPYPELKQAIADNLKVLALNDITPERAAAAIETVSRSTKR